MSRLTSVSCRIRVAAGTLLVAGLATACGGGAKSAVSARSVTTTSDQSAGAVTSTSGSPEASGPTSTSAGSPSTSTSAAARTSASVSTTTTGHSATSTSRPTTTTGAPTTTPAPSTTMAPTSTTRASTTTTTAAATAVTAIETEYHIALSAGSFHSGSYVFTAENHGQLTHNLIISGNGTMMQTPDLAPGQSASLKLDLRPGSYELYCGIPGHRQAGMDVTIQVT